MARTGSRAERVAERRQQILDAARTIAEADGWAAVTSRRLADAIGYTQPVLYGHFPGGKTEIMRTVALAGFTELAAATRVAMRGGTGPQAVAAVAEVYLDFAATHPSLYEAMFQLPIDARFAQDDAESELRAGFDALGAALGTDDGTVTEVFWSALHGMSQLERVGRMRREHRPLRIAELAARFAT
ncbi:TetR/AcrR family transcriptional regulator [Actinophytocola oryzae]|uniref:TetR family transcriptional regulator n=1 Tax=Actinophytocola oryzae TaxID=502181 RepID=A0A4R7V0R5_9PSEU|nr:TetR/AcrR family transcriptional regulator [Actinophytocola oryzae]TDV41405.1 TetR family transcriptional regulator [Actinophytocola oryzae]